MKETLFSFFILAFSMFIIDGLWLGGMYERFYAPAIQHLLGDSVKIIPVLILYLLYTFALNIFVVIPALNNHQDSLQLFLTGMLFGLTAYGAYDLTNQATLKNWPWSFTLIDMAWGSFLTGLISLIAVSVTRYFYPLK